MPSYDVRCTACKHEETIVRKADESNGVCPVCGCVERTVFWRTVPILDKAKDPYDLLDGKGSRPDGKRIFSGPKVKSKTTV